MRQSAPPAGRLTPPQRIRSLLGLDVHLMALSLALPIGAQATIGDGGWVQQDSGGSVWFDRGHLHGRAAWLGGERLTAASSPP